MSKGTRFKVAGLEGLGVWGLRVLGSGVWGVEGLEAAASQILPVDRLGVWGIGRGLTARSTSPQTRKKYQHSNPKPLTPNPKSQTLNPEP